MHTKLVPVASHNGFKLSEPIEFEDYLCLITGVNGIGKSRLLNSIANGKTKLYLDNNEIPTNEIRLIDINELNHTILYPSGGIDKTTLLARNIMTLIEQSEGIETLPDTFPMQLEQMQRAYSGVEIKVKDIVKRACHLFDTEPQHLQKRQLELSIYANNELSNGSLNEIFSDTHLSLSQLTVNYYQAKECNDLLEYFNKKDPHIKFIDEHVLLEKIGKKSPSVIFNEIIHDLFKGKFKISEPNLKKTPLESYEPKLLDLYDNELNPKDLSSGEVTIFWLVTKIFQTFYSAIGINFTKAKVILMDEPDVHLHPMMIVDFYRCLKKLHDELHIIFIFNSHSPTTVALADFDNIFKLTSVNNIDFSLEKITKDGGISILLEGVTQITINPENRREVYVENVNDANIYELIYRKIKNKTKLTPDITLSFTTPASKIVDSQLHQHITSIYENDERVKRLIEKINGQGNCEQVIGTIENLKKIGNRTAVGLIDWDGKDRKTDSAVVALGKGYCYAIENAVYDPISIFVFVSKFKDPSYFCSCNAGSNKNEILPNNQLLQEIFDRIMSDILGHENRRDHQVTYMNKITLLADKEYYSTKGKDIEKRVLTTYPELKKIQSFNNHMTEMYNLLKYITIDELDCQFINIVFEEAFIKLQAAK
ncbi:AAA family ATPase [Citrobacter sp. UYEF32]|uniref:AAA family ATPase n=1 Tax=Citrobacter sp. UYEF32 TaxID=3156347 RepID=UPI003391E8F1